MIDVGKFIEHKRLIDSGYVAEIYLNKKGVPEPWGGMYHLTSWDRRIISREMFLALAENYQVEKRYGYLKIKKEA